MVEEHSVEVVTAPCNFLHEKGGFLEALNERDVEGVNLLHCVAGLTIRILCGADCEGRAGIVSLKLESDDIGCGRGVHGHKLEGHDSVQLLRVVIGRY
jgi:hypothetical protein